MSTRTGLWLSALLALPSLLAAISLTACTRTTPPDSATIDELAYGNFQTAVASIPDRQFEVYWLGREFTAGGIVFRGPHFATIGGVVGADRLIVSYDGPLPARGSVGLTISLYRASSRGSTSTPRPSGPAGALPRPVTVAGHPAELSVETAPPGRPVNRLQVVVDLGETTAVISTNSGGSATPGGPDVNPLVNDVQLFLSVMQQLRPYPQ